MRLLCIMSEHNGKVHGMVSKEKGRNSKTGLIYIWYITRFHWVIEKKS